MGFKLLVLNPVEQEGTEYINAWPDKLKETIPGIEVNLARSVGEAMEVIGEVDAAFGNIVPELFERAQPQVDRLSSSWSQSWLLPPGLVRQ